MTGRPFAAAVMSAVLACMPLAARSQTAPLDGSAGIVVIEGTQRGEMALDCVGTPCLNGPVALAIQGTLGNKAITVAAFFDSLHRRVRDLTQGKQVPWMAASAPVDVPLVHDPARARALVIGNDAYLKIPALPGAGRDAALVGKVLAEAGFAVQTLVDVQGPGFKTSLQDFFRSLAAGDIAVVYYAGHGFSESGANYLPALEADLSDRAGLLGSAVEAGELIEAFRKTAAARKLLILDTHFPPLPPAGSP